MKKILATILAAVVLSLSACTEESATNSTTPTEQAPVAAGVTFEKVTGFWQYGRDTTTLCQYHFAKDHFFVTILPWNEGACEVGYGKWEFSDMKDRGLYTDSTAELSYHLTHRGFIENCRDSLKAGLVANVFLGRTKLPEDKPDPLFEQFAVEKIILVRDTLWSHGLPMFRHK